MKFKKKYNLLTTKMSSEKLPIVPIPERADPPLISLKNTFKGPMKNIETAIYDVLSNQLEDIDPKSLTLKLSQSIRKHIVMKHGSKRDIEHYSIMITLICETCKGSFKEVSRINKSKLFANLEYVEPCGVFHPILFIDDIKIKNCSKCHTKNIKVCGYGTFVDRTSNFMLDVYGKTKEELLPDAERLKIYYETQQELSKDKYKCITCKKQFIFSLTDSFDLGQECHECISSKSVVLEEDLTPKSKKAKKK